MMEQQLSINFEPRKLARRTDPATSHSAAAMARELRARDHLAIVACLREHGPMDGRSIMRRLGWTDPGKVTRRLPELNDRMIRRTGKTVINETGRPADLWEAIPINELEVPA